MLALQLAFLSSSHVFTYHYLGTNALLSKYWDQVSTAYRVDIILAYIIQDRYDVNVGVTTYVGSQVCTQLTLTLLSFLSLQTNHHSSQTKSWYRTCSQSFQLLVLIKIFMSVYTVLIKIIAIHAPSTTETSRFSNNALLHSSNFFHLAQLVTPSNGCNFN